VHSAIYEGVVTHRRIAGPTTGSGHSFSYRVAMLYLDLDEIDDLVAIHGLWRAGPGPAAVRIERRDLPGDRSLPAPDAIRRLVGARLDRIPDGPIAVLLHPRTWGWLFNPITCAYCFDTNRRVTALAAEVTNTPWHERTTYVVGGPGTHDLTKTMHVSPFLPMDVTYRVRYGTPGDHLDLGIDVFRQNGGPPPDAAGILPSDVTAEAGDVVLRTALHLRRYPATHRSMGRMLWRYPLMTARVSAGIYAQALRLRLAGAVFHPHPGTNDYV